MKSLALIFMALVVSSCATTFKDNSPLSSRATAGAGGICRADHVKNIQNLLDQGKSVLVVAVERNFKCPAESESCGDWAENLNRVAGQYEVVKIPNYEWAQTFLNIEQPQEFSTLFLKGKAGAYFYNGPISESQVYLAVSKAWANIPKDDFLPKALTAELCQ